MWFNMLDWFNMLIGLIKTVSTSPEFFYIRGSTSGHRSFGLYYYNNVDQYYQMRIGSGVGYYCTLPEFEFNKWYHVCVVFDDQTNTVDSQKIYFNGELLSLDASNSTRNCYGDTFDLEFGPNSDVGVMFDDLTVYNAVLSATEVQELYTSNAIASKTMAQYTFEDDTRSTDKSIFTVNTIIII